MPYNSFEISRTVEMRSIPDDLADHSDCSNTGTRDRIHSSVRRSNRILLWRCAVWALQGAQLVCLQSSVVCRRAQCKLKTEGRMPMFKLG